MSIDVIEIAKRFKMDAGSLRFSLELSKNTYDEWSVSKLQDSKKTKRKHESISGASKKLLNLLLENKVSDELSYTAEAHVWDQGSDVDNKRMTSLVSELTWFIKKMDIVKVNPPPSQATVASFRIECLAEDLAITFIAQRRELPTCSKEDGYSSTFYSFIKAVLPYFGLTKEADASAVAESFIKKRNEKYPSYDYWLKEAMLE